MKAAKLQQIAESYKKALIQPKTVTQVFTRNLRQRLWTTQTQQQQTNGDTWGQEEIELVMDISIRERITTSESTNSELESRRKLLQG